MKASGGGARIHGVEHPQVEKLQLRVEPLGLEVLFAPVLERMKHPTSVHEKTSSSRNSRRW